MSSTSLAPYLGPGSVLSLRPDAPVKCYKGDSVLKAAKLMTEKRVGCVIVIDPSTNRICGLATSKDLAFRVVANSLNPTNTPIEAIMTSDPYISYMNTSANDALKLMVSKKVRHLPLIDQNNIVEGMLNITKCFYHAMVRLEKMALEAKKLQVTFDDLNKTSDALNLDVDNYNHGNNTNNNNNTHNDNDGSEIEKFSLINSQDLSNHGSLTCEDPLSTADIIDLNIRMKKRKIVDDLKRLIDIMQQPDLKSVLSSNNSDFSPVVIDATSSVFHAAKVLKDMNITAVLVSDSFAIPGAVSAAKGSETPRSDQIIGILTTKDIAFRALAMNIDPVNVGVARIMTPKPNYADESLCINNALRMMYEGKFLNLPVRNSRLEITGIVSVLQLTYELLRTLDRPIYTTPEYDERSSNSDRNGNIKMKFNSKYMDESSGPAWNQFWGALNQPLNTAESNEKSSRHSSFLVSSPKTFSVNSDRKFSNTKSSLISSRENSFRVNAIQNDGSDGNSSFRASSKRLMKHLESLKDQDSGYHSSIPSLNIKSDLDQPNPEVVNNSQATSATINEKFSNQILSSPQMDKKDVFYKLKIRDKLKDSRGLNKIYKFRISNSGNDFSGVLEDLESQVYSKLSLDRKEISHDLGYIDEDNDLVSIEKDEDLQNAIEYFNRIDSKTVVLLMNVRERYSVSVTHDITSSSSYLTFGAICTSAFLLGLYLSKRYSN
ncbi:hypothetical protein BVG19_g4152 [[Candida] boidinii]|nr:hypothetical protein BVG19_g4152 [[Candida] boidinii]OWB51144.1 hypothetical protein B5S27_g2702 [[Candida] boidinii]